MNSIIKSIQNDLSEVKEHPTFSSGDTITVYYEIKEGSKTRTQFFKGVVLQRRGEDATETFTIRKMSGNIGVERIFEITFTSDEKDMFDHSVSAVKQLNEVASKFEAS